MAEESIILISKEYATDNFQSKLTEANQGDNIKITGEGDNLKISAEIPAHAKTTITTSDERVAVTETQTGYDLALNGSFIEEGEYRVLESTVGGHTTSITNLEQSVGGKQDALSAGTGINLNNNTISVDTATSVGTSNLPVTASAVNTKLGDYATTTDLNNKQDKLSWYSESGGGMDPYKVDIAANEVTLRAGGDTVGMIYENAKISLSQEDGQISITSNFGSNDHSHLNILKTEKELMHDSEKIVIGDSYNSMSVFIAGPLYDKDGNEITGGGGGSFKYISESNGWPYSLSLGRGPNGTANSIFVCGPLYGEDEAILVKGDITFEHSVYIQGPIVDKNNYITLIQGKETYDGSGVHQVVIGDGSHSVYINGPLYDKDGNEITGGGGSKYIKDESDAMGDSVFIGDYYGDKPFAIDISSARNLILSVGTKRIFIDETKLAKLEELLNGQG